LETIFSVNLITKFIRRLTLLEWVVIATIVLLLIALLIPATQWASSGDIELPVRVLVFDAQLAMPITGARVGILRGPPWIDDEFSVHYRKYFAPGIFDGILKTDQGVTDTNGQVVVNYKFRTGASHKRPIPHAHTSWVWAAVQADGFGGAVVQVRQESVPTSQLREQKELRVPIGLIRVETD
jgi:hypothetical protein